MPTYNDEQYIEVAIKSVLEQTYSSWELLIMDDGSTDKTASVIKTIEDKRIRLFQQPNQGQLKAINNLSEYITGDLVMMLHSDDQLYTSTSLENNVKYFDDISIDGVYSSIIQFYPSGKPDKQTVSPRAMTNNGPQKLLMLLGSNFIPDPFLIRKEKFFKNVVNNYLIWNYPYWINFQENKVSNLKLQYSEFPWYYYRVYNENYSNSIIGNFETFLGRMRSIYLLSSFYTVPFPSIQKELVRRFNIIGIALPLKASKKHLAHLIKLLIRNMQKRTPGAYTWYFEQLQHFYSQSGKRSIRLESKIESLYQGGEGRNFFNDLKENTIPPVYKEIISGLKEGFSSIRVSNVEEKQIIENILKFLCVRSDVLVEEK